MNSTTRWSLAIGLCALSFASGIYVGTTLQQVPLRAAQLPDYDSAWWVVTTITVGPEGDMEIPYAHMAHRFDRRPDCEDTRRDLTERARRNAMAIGPHYVTTVSRCRGFIVEGAKLR